MSIPTEGYLVLPSNAKTDLYPNNTSANYTVPLTHELRLEGAQYKAELKEITYTNSWDNMVDGTITVNKMAING